MSGRLQRVLVLTAVGGSVLATAVAPAAQADARVTCTRGPVPIGAPKADVGRAKGAGYVEIRRNCDAAEASQRLTLPRPHAGDNFGAAITDVSFTGGKGLLIGIPNYDVGRLRNAGAIASYQLTSTGLRLKRIITQNSPGIPGQAQAGAQFGSVLAAQIDPNEGYSATVRVGVPSLDIGRAADAGGVVDLYFEGGVFAPRSSRLLTLNTRGVRGTPHTGDRFGAAIGGTDLSRVGVPGREVAGHAGAGAVLLSATKWVSQRTACVPGSPETGDHFGAALTGDWIGVPGEDLDGRADAGMVNRYTSDGNECSSLSELTRGFQGVVHAGDHFGAVLYENHFFYDAYYHPTGLLVGAPGADTAAGKNSGTLNVVAERSENEDDDDDAPGRLIQVSRSWTTIAGSSAGAALGTAIGLTYSNANVEDDGYVLASAPGGRGRVFALTGKGKALVVHHVYRPTATRAGAYGATLVGNH